MGASTAAIPCSSARNPDTNWDVRLRSSSTTWCASISTCRAQPWTSLPVMPPHSRAITSCRIVVSLRSSAKASGTVTAYWYRRFVVPPGMRLTASLIGLRSRVNGTNMRGPGSVASATLSAGPKPASSRSTDSAAARSPPNAMLPSSTRITTSRPVPSVALDDTRSGVSRRGAAAGPDSSMYFSERTGRAWPSIFTVKSDSVRPLTGAPSFPTTDTSTTTNSAAARNEGCCARTPAALAAARTQASNWRRVIGAPWDRACTRCEPGPGTRPPPPPGAGGRRRPVRRPEIS